MIKEKKIEFTPKLSFLDYIQNIPQEYVQSFRVFCQIKDGKEEKTKLEWQVLYNQMMNRKTN
jgi:hypothetical protein